MRDEMRDKGERREGMGRELQSKVEKLLLGVTMPWRQINEYFS
jgi:hypothetical protein